MQRIAYLPVVHPIGHSGGCVGGTFCARHIRTLQYSRGVKRKLAQVYQEGRQRLKKVRFDEPIHYLILSVIMSAMSSIIYIYVLYLVDVELTLTTNLLANFSMLYRAAKR